MDALAARLILSASGLTAGRLCRLLHACGSPESVLEATDEDLLAVTGITALEVRKLRQAARTVNGPALKAKLEEWSGRLLACTDEAYPALLRETPDPPALLFVQGEPHHRDEMAVAIVGTRKCTPYGAMVARRLAGDLARRGFTIVSGLALGIDAAAHEGALEAGGRTLAVMASGLDVTYPSEHRALRERIVASGQVLTEQPFGMPPLAALFPVRNRLVAGLALGTIVVEAPTHSGAMITARLAAEAGREVFGVPGSVDSPVSRGPHQLIKEGARLVEVAEDVVEGLGILLEAVPPRRPAPEVVVSGDERAVLEALSYQPRHMDEVVAASCLGAAQVSATLMMLEIKGLIKRFPGNAYVRL